jgi:integrase
MSSNANVTLKFVLRTSNARDDGRAPIYLRITANRKSRFKTTGILVKPKHWNENKQEVRKSHELASAYNDKLRRIWLTAEEAGLSASSAAEVKAAVEGTRGSLTDYFEAYIDRLDRRDQFWQKRKFKTTLRKLQESFGRKGINWNDLNRQALEAFEDHCLEERDNNPNTTRKELSRLRRVVRQAIKDERIGVEDDPFPSYEMPQKVEPDRTRLTREEIRQLETADLEGEAAVARDAFLFSFYGGGIRFGDLCRLRLEHITGEGRLQYRMMKTERPVDLPLPAPALQIAERRSESHEKAFIFPFLIEADTSDPVTLRRRISSRNVQVNRALKEACRQAGIDEADEVTMHVARHSFADYARRSSDDLYAVSKALGHSDLKTTEDYLSSFDKEATDRLAADMWEGERDG